MFIFLHIYRFRPLFNVKDIKTTYRLLHFGDMMLDTMELSRLWAMPRPSIITESEENISGH